MWISPRGYMVDITITSGQRQYNSIGLYSCSRYKGVNCCRLASLTIQRLIKTTYTIDAGQSAVADFIVQARRRLEFHQIRGEFIQAFVIYLNANIQLADPGYGQEMTAYAADSIASQSDSIINYAVAVYRASQTMTAYAADSVACQSGNDSIRCRQLSEPVRQ